ncbi:hypothetical protein [Bdellovibrio sp. HCB209]|uniref:hypothetical protein n=1 Tax=Bdellovibrio sp. HCB209 TaxID=3394354 RepID=UPI0039B5C824
MIGSRFWVSKGKAVQECAAFFISAIWLLKNRQGVLPDWALADAPVHLVYQKHLFTPPEVQAFVAYMEPALKPFFEGI